MVPHPMAVGRGGVVRRGQGGSVTPFGRDGAQSGFSGNKRQRVEPLTDASCSLPVATAVAIWYADWTMLDRIAALLAAFVIVIMIVGQQMFLGQRRTSLAVNRHRRKGSALRGWRSGFRGYAGTRYFMGGKAGHLRQGSPGSGRGGATGAGPALRRFLTAGPGV